MGVSCIQMGSIITIVVVLLTILNSSEVAYSQQQQQDNSGSNPATKDTSHNRQNSLPDENLVPSTENIQPSDEGNRDRQTLETSDSLDFSDTGRPGQQTAGESRGSCSLQANNNLEAVIPVSHSGKTVSGHPRFWVYFPYTPHQISHVEFVVQNEAREDVWRSQLSIENDTGYKSFSIPKTEAPLEIGRWYRWYVKVYCDRSASAGYVQGWVNRVPLLSRLYLELQQKSQLSHQIYGSHGIWYDAIDRLLTVYQSRPGNMALERDWQNFIRARGVRLQQLPQIETSYEAVK